MAQAIGTHGKNLSVGDQVTISGKITNITGTGQAATLTVSTSFSGSSISIQAKDVVAHAQTE